jgi:sphingomyelin phosphodiesterase
MIYFTGDIVDHTMWETSVERNLDSMEKIYELFRELFGTDIPIYSTLGNHEGHPVNT